MVFFHGAKDGFFLHVVEFLIYVQARTAMAPRASNHQPEGNNGCYYRHEPSLTSIHHDEPSLTLTTECLRLFFEVVDALRFLLQNLFDLRHHPNIGWTTTASTWVSRGDGRIFQRHIGVRSSSCLHTA